MELLTSLYDTFLRFLSWEEISFLFTGTGLLVTFNLVLSEALLSFDNALVLALLVSPLPTDRFYKLGPLQMSIQKWALAMGLFGAYFFRLIAIGLGVYLVQFWFFHLIGGSYLLWLAYEYFSLRNEEEREIQPNGQSFWAVVVKLTLVDIAFSIDSILAALGISKRIWAVLMGGILGMLFVRLAAGVLVHLINRFPLLKVTGYALVALVGYRLTSEVDWVHFTTFFSYIGSAGTLLSILSGMVILGVARVKKRRLETVEYLLFLALMIMLFSWTGTQLHLQMSDLQFSLIMLCVFFSTFILNPFYTRRLEKACGEKHAGMDDQ